MDLGLLLVVVASVPLVVLGGGIVALPGRRRDTWLLGAFLVAWAGGPLVARYVEDPFWGHLGGAVLFVVAGILVLLFAARSSKRARVGPWLAGYVAFLALVVLLARLRDASPPATAGVVGSTYFAAFAGALVIVYRDYLDAQAGSERRRYRDLLVALVLFPGYVGALGAWGAPSAPIDETLPFLVPLAVVAGIFLHALARPVRPDGRDPLLLVLVAAPALLGVLTNVTNTTNEFGLSGVARLGTASLLAYAIARRHLFDVELRLKRLVGPGLALLAVGYGGVAAIAARAWWPLAIGLGVGLMAYAARRDLGLLFVPGDVANAEYARARKLEVYRASLEAAMASGVDASSPELKRLRRSFGISDEEHAQLAQSPRTTSPRPQTTRVVLGKYRLDRVLGEGAHGRTHLARDLATGEEVAVKITRDAVREADVLRRVSHANVVRILDAGEEDDRAVLVMDYAGGGSLHGLLRRRGALSREEAARMLAGILDGLGAVHAAGLVHRDVKPENVLLSAEGEPKLADFGIAREARLDVTGMTMGGAGTLLYMSPEQVRGTGADARSDLYAVAAIFHQLLTGRHYLPIAGRDDFQIRSLILQGDSQLHLPAELADVEPFLRVGLAKDPTLRYQSAAEMRRALAGILRTPGALPPTSPASIPEAF